MLEYTIVSATTTDALVEAVQAQLDDGRVPTGGVSVHNWEESEFELLTSHERVTRRTEFVQALTRQHSG